MTFWFSFPTQVLPEGGWPTIVSTMSHATQATEGDSALNSSLAQDGVVVDSPLRVTASSDNFGSIDDLGRDTGDESYGGTSDATTELHSSIRSGAEGAAAAAAAAGSGAGAGTGSMSTSSGHTTSRLSEFVGTYLCCWAK